MNFTIREYDGPNGTPAVHLLIRGHGELLDSGLAPPELVSHWEQQVLVAFAGEIPVGVMAYSHEKHRKVVWISLGYVIPEARKRGIYRHLWEHLIGIAAKLGAAEIHGSTSIRNIAMLEFCRTFGREQIAVTTRFKVPPAPEVMAPEDGKAAQQVTVEIYADNSKLLNSLHESEAEATRVSASMVESFNRVGRAAARAVRVKPAKPKAPKKAK